MTSTSFNVGLTDNTRLSSRVLRPPGGGHTDIFGGEPEPPRGRRPAPHHVVGQGDEPKQSNGTAEAQNGNASVEPQPVQVEAPASIPEAPASTPEAPKENPIQAPEPMKADPPKRVRVPPGGFSSGLW